MVTILDRITSSQFVGFLLFAVASFIAVGVILALMGLSTIAAWIVILASGIIAGILTRRYIPVIGDYLRSQPFLGILLLAAVFGIISFVSPFLLVVQTPYAVTGSVTLSFTNFATLFGNAVNQGLTGILVGGIFGIGATVGASVS